MSQYDDHPLMHIAELRTRAFEVRTGRIEAEAHAKEAKAIAEFAAEEEARAFKALARCECRYRLWWAAHRWDGPAA